MEKYRTTPVTNVGEKLIVLPWSSLGREISNVANMVTMADHVEASPVDRPE
jgi:hypothetical protein